MATTEAPGNMAATRDRIEAQAKESAAELLRQGWAERGAKYDIGTYHGDAEALEERLGRPTTRDERVALETMIRERLDAAYRGDESASLKGDRQ